MKTEDGIRTRVSHEVTLYTALSLYSLLVKERHFKPLCPD